jgi:hypothetical protein
MWAASTWRNGFSFILPWRTQTTEGTGIKNTLPEETLMSQVVYRGVSYDTIQRRQAQAQQQQQPSTQTITYRGKQYVKETN